MGTEVLRPHDCLIHRIRAPIRSGFYNNNNYQAPIRSNQKRKASLSSRVIARRYSDGDLRHSKHSIHSNNRHRIVRQGEPMVKMSVEYKDSRSRSLSPKLVSGGTTDVYAGSAIFVSPSPESLPLPSFSRKKQVDDSATRDLRRLLRIDCGSG